MKLLANPLPSFGDVLDSISDAPPREEGLDYAQIGIGLAIAAGITVIGLAIGTDLFSANRIQQASLQIHNAVVAAQQYRSVTGDYEDIDVEELVDNGFILPGFSDDGTDENVYGLDLVIASADSNANAQIEYETDSAEACAQLLLRFEEQDFITGTPACGATDFKLTFKVD